MNPAPPNTYTAARIAGALGTSRQSVYEALRGIPAPAKLFVSGQETSAWAFAELPESLQTRLQLRAQQQHYRDAGAMLADQQKPWKPPMPLDKVRQSFKDKATNLREAMRLPIVRQHELSGPPLTELGLQEFKRIFGYKISAKRWRRLFDQVMDRDRGFEDFERVELYVDAGAFRRPVLARSQASFTTAHQAALGDIIANLENKTTPTADDRQWLFDAAFRHFETLTADHSEKRVQRTIKASLITFLYSAIPGLSKTPKALRRVFELNLIKWRGSGRNWLAIEDQRRNKSGNFRRPDFSADDKMIRQRAIELGGKGHKSQAYRDVRSKLSRKYQDYYSFDMRDNKSNVPQATRDAIAPGLQEAVDYRESPWKFKMRGPYIPRDWDDVLAGDYFTADDMTSNSRVYMARETLAGWACQEIVPGRWDVIRPDGVFYFDFACDYPVSALFTTGRITGCLCKSGLLKAHDAVGLPRKGVWFENGPWRSRYIRGDNNRTSTRWERTVGDLKANWGVELRPHPEGLEVIGVETNYHLPRNPRAKPAEAVFRRMQERTRAERGFVGFNERLNRQDRVQEFIARVKAGKEDPRNELYTLEQWAERWTCVSAEFANEPQNGKRLRGRSPAEAWHESIDTKPLRKLPSEARYLLASYETVKKIGTKGILLTIGKERMLYCNDDTGKMIGREVLCYYNLEFPDLLTCSDLSRQNYFSVKRVHLPAVSASSEQIREANAQIKGHTRAAKIACAELRHSRVSTITRDNEHDDATKELGRFHNAEVEQAKVEMAADSRKLNRIQLEAAAAGVAVNPLVRNPDRVLRGLELEKAARERIAQREKERVANMVPPAPAAAEDGQGRADD